VVARALDFENAMAPGFHPGASAVLIALAAAELARVCSGKDFLTALALGVEIASRLNLPEVGSSAILEATVFGVPDDYWGETVKAVVALKPGQELTEEELIEFCAQNISSWKKPKSLDFLNELPKSPQGKILKRVLREKYWAYLEKKI
jgi:acyl-CoA synthetase (AMP-forming)/AMP-acid ligase II